MHIFYLVPVWFNGYDLVFEMIFALITLMVGLKAFQVYKISGQEQAKFFGVSFILISLCHFFQGFLNFVVLANFNEFTESTANILKAIAINNTATYLHVLFFLLALLILAYMTLNIKSPKTFVLLFIITIISILFVPNQLFIVNILSTVLLFYIFIHYLGHYIEHKRVQTLLVFIAFALLFLVGSLHFIIFPISHDLDYIMDHILTFVAYALILANFIMVEKHEQKKG
jgi:hypothetical protein